MFWLLASALIVILFCLTLHYVKHFRLRKCYSRGRSFIDNGSNSQMKLHSQARRTMRSMSIVRFSAHIQSLRKIHTKTRWRCCLVEIDDAEFGFYPFAFLLYVLFLLIVSFVITFEYIFIENDFNFDNSLFINVQFENVINNITYSYHNLSSYSTYSAQLSVMHWIIIYCLVMISSLESFFNFYRYFSIRYSAKYMHSATTFHIIKCFSIYFFIFTAIFIIQIHFYYLLFPLVTCIYFVYNMYCSYAFHAIFVEQYKHSNILQDVADDMMATVRLMRNISVFSCIISTICIGMFTVITDIHILYYLPLAWSVSCICFTLNFVRNRQILCGTAFTFYQCIRHCQIKKFQFDMNFKRDSLSSAKKKKHEQNLNIIIHSDVEIQAPTPGCPGTPITPSVTPMASKNEITYAHRYNCADDNKSVELSMDISQQEQDEEEEDEPNDNDNDNDSNPDSKPSKAFSLLGISKINIPALAPNMNIMSSIAEENKMDIDDGDIAYMDDMYDEDLEIVDKCHFNSYSVDFGDFGDDFKLQKKDVQFGVHTAGNSPVDLYLDVDDNDSEEGLDGIEALEMTIKVSSSEKVLNSDKYQKHKRQMRLHRKRSISNPRIMVTPAVTNQTDIEVLVLKNQSSTPSPYAHAFKNKNTANKHCHLNSCKSRSDDLFNIDVAQNVMDLMVGHGFYSRKSWNSIQQLRQFQKVNAIHK